MTRIIRVLQAASADAVPPAEAASMESDFVVILAALLCALICVVGLIAIARCAWLRRSPVAGAGGASPRRRALANRGLKKKVLNSLPRFTYVAGGGDNSGASAGDQSKWVASSECAICLAEFAAGDEVRVLPQCGHGFHVACIDTWLGSHSSCPSCRALLAVARCQKCGQFPAVPGGGAALVAVAGEAESKPVDCGNAGAAAANCSNSNNVNNDYLP